MLGAGDGSSLKTWNKVPESSVRAKPLVDIEIISVSSSNNRGFEIAFESAISELGTRLGSGERRSLKSSSMSKLPGPSLIAKPLVLIDTEIISVSSSNDRGFEIALGTLRSELRRIFGAGDGNNFEADDTLPEQSASD